MAGVRRYELLEKIGAGGMAEVYLAEALAPDGSKRRLVVKKIHPHYSEDPDYRRMFMDEARIAGSLDHPNIVKVVDLGRMDDQLFIAMELVEGRDLQFVLRAARAAKVKVPLDVALYVTAEVLRALDHAHTRTLAGKPLKIVHRDVTPQNILVSAAGAVKVTDFGVAKAAIRAGQTVAGVIKGNVRYMAPEQVSSKEIDHRVDVYAAGMLLHALLSGKHPFEDDPLVKAIDRCISGLVPKPSEINPEVPPVLDAIAMQAIALEPAKRFPTAAAFLQAIETVSVPRRALALGKAGVGPLVRIAQFPAEQATGPRAISIAARLGPLIAEAANEGGESVFRTTGRMVNPDVMPSQADPAAARKSKPPLLLAGHGDAISALAPFPDAKRLATASLDGTIRIWNLAAATEEATLRGHTNAVTCCAVSGDGAFVLSGGRDNRVRFWDAKGDLKATLEGHEGWVFAVALAPDGRHAISGGFDRVAHVWDLVTRKPILTLAGHRDTISAVSFSPDGKWGITASYDGTVRVWDLKSGDLRRTFESENETESVRAMAVSTDGTLVATGGSDAIVRLWDFHSGIELRTLAGHREPVTGVAVSRNLKLAVSAGYDATARLWAIEQGVLIRTFDLTGPVAGVALAPDLRWLATGGVDRTITVLPL